MFAFLKNIPRTAAVAAFVALAGAGAQAAVVTVNWTGEITSTGGHAGVSVGDTITGTYSYDSTSPVDPGGPSGTSAAREYRTGHVSSFVLGAYSGSFTDQNIFVSTDVNDGFQPGVTHQLDSRTGNAGSNQVYTGSTFSGNTPSQLFVRLNDSSATALPSNALPGSLDPADWTLTSSLRSRIDGTGIAFLTRSFTATTDGGVAPVPLPATLPLAALALGALGLAHRRRKET